MVGSVLAGTVGPHGRPAAAGPLLDFAKGTEAEFGAQRRIGRRSGRVRVGPVPEGCAQDVIKEFLTNCTANISSVKI